MANNPKCWKQKEEACSSLVWIQNEITRCQLITKSFQIFPDYINKQNAVILAVDKNEPKALMSHTG